MELMIALLVSSIVLGAVAVLANAATIASAATDDMSRSQSHLQQIAFRFTDVIRRANCVLGTSADEFSLWHDINADGLATADELTRIWRGSGGQGLSVGSLETYASCSNVTFAYDYAAPLTRFVTVWFDLSENGQTQRYSISAHLRGSDIHRKF